MNESILHVMNLGKQECLPRDIGGVSDMPGATVQHKYILFLHKLPGAHRQIYKSSQTQTIFIVGGVNVLCCMGVISVMLSKKKQKQIKDWSHITYNM